MKIIKIKKGVKVMLITIALLGTVVPVILKLSNVLPYWEDIGYFALFALIIGGALWLIATISRASDHASIP